MAPGEPDAVAGDQAAQEEKTEEQKSTDKQLAKALLKEIAGDGDDERTTISKKISWILRHGAKRVQVEISQDGWVLVNDLLSCEFMADIPNEKILQVIADSNVQKPRYELLNSSEGQKIRAISKAGSGVNVRADRAGLKRRGGEKSNRELTKGAAASSKDKESGDNTLRKEASPFVPSHLVAQHMSAMMPNGYYPPFGWPQPFGYSPYGMWPGAYPGYAPQSAYNDAYTQEGDEHRYRGRIKSYNVEKGFGFIECAETHAKFGRDVFVHKAHVGNFEVDAEVTFTVETNNKDMPQAKNLKAADAGGKKGKGKGKSKSKDKGKSKGKDEDDDRGEGPEGRGKGSAPAAKKWVVKKADPEEKKEATEEKKEDA